MKLSSLKNSLFILILVLLLSGRVVAQWSADSLLNLAIADTIGEQVLPKIAGTSDGGCYISWFDSRSGSYAVYMQYLNSRGEAQWTPNGLLISNHPQMSWLVDYDLTVDPNDNAIIVFGDVRNGGISDLDIFAYKIAPDGSFLWGADGIGLSDTTAAEFEPAPRVTSTDSGNVVVAWQKSGNTNVICLQKLSVNGQKLWGDNGIILQGNSGESLSYPDVISVGNDTVIAVWKNSTGPFWAPVTKLFTQKFDPHGLPVWGGTGVLIYNLGAIPLTETPRIYSDYAGGAFYTYYDAPSLSQFNVWVQHVAADGSLLFPLNGIQASIKAGFLHMYPALSYLPITNELYVFWVEENINQDEYGVYGQKFSSGGDRLWSDYGKEFVPLTGNPISFLRSSPADSFLYVGYFQGSAPNAYDDAVKVFSLDRNGNLRWPVHILSPASLGSKGRLQMIVNTEQRSFLVWKDERNDSGDIYAQNINPDGTLGNPPVFIGGKRNRFPLAAQLHQNYPNPFNPTTTISFDLTEKQFVKLEIYNVRGQFVKRLLEKELPAGGYQVNWDGRDEGGNTVSSGLYIYRIQAGSVSASTGYRAVQTRKMILVR